MSDDIQVGDSVRLVDVPNWLVHDLPEDEQNEIRSFVGQCAVVSEIDKYGYIWLGFGMTYELGDEARYSGHAFAVPPDCVQLVES